MPQPSFHRAVRLLLPLLGLATPAAAQSRWLPPPTARVKPGRNRPRLVNYAHRADFELGPDVPHREEKLAQWDVIVLNPDHDLSLPRIRRINPRIRILLWAPLQGPGNYRFSKGFNPVWWGRDTDGKLIKAPWGEHVANPYAGRFGYPRHLLRVLASRREAYDGVMYDCASESNWMSMDLNQDGRRDEKDVAAQREAVTYLLQETRKQFPRWIVTANGGPTWSEDSPYWSHANGNVHENVLGDEFYPSDWKDLWAGLTRMSARCRKPQFQFHLVDLRRGRDQKQAEQAMSLTPDDLRRMRLGLVSCMMVDGAYFGFDRGDCLHGQLWWFREYEANLGPARGRHQWDRYGKGLLSREFEQAVLIVNPTSQPQTLHLQSAMRDVTTQQRSAAPVLPPQDARIYLR